MRVRLCLTVIDFVDPKVESRAGKLQVATSNSEAKRSTTVARTHPNDAA